MSRRSLAIVAGLLWISGGVILVVRAIPMAQKALDGGTSTSHLALFVLAGLLFGGAKGKFVLSKSAKRNLTRLDTLPEPVRPWQALPVYLYFLIPVMIGMGIGIRAWADQGSLPGGWATASAVYFGIGAALFVSGMVYFKKKEPSN